MSQNLEARMHGHQPRLPLVEQDDPGGATTTDTDAEWRLDEHTRLVGRMGIAAARARLHSGAGQRRPGDSPMREPNRTTRAPGRAA